MNNGSEVPTLRSYIKNNDFSSKAIIKIKRVHVKFVFTFQLNFLILSCYWSNLYDTGWIFPRRILKNSHCTRVTFVYSACWRGSGRRRHIFGQKTKVSLSPMFWLICVRWYSRSHRIVLDAKRRFIFIYKLGGRVHHWSSAPDCAAFPRLKGLIVGERGARSYAHKPR